MSNPETPTKKPKCRDCGRFLRDYEPCQRCYIRQMDEAHDRERSARLMAETAALPKCYWPFAECICGESLGKARA